jgi:hypothetical protein
MSPDEIQHFLVAFDPATGAVDVTPFGNDYGAAQRAYAQAEQSNVESKLDVVLLSADSLETIKKTHSSYFEGGEVRVEELLPG